MLLYVRERVLKLFRTLYITFVSEIARSYYLVFGTKMVSKNIWLIAETAEQAQDNGFYFYQYLRENHSEVNAYYLISKNSPHVDKFKDKDRLVYVHTFKHMLFLLSAKNIISTHGLWMIPKEFGVFKKITRNMLRAKGIMLQHGITAIKDGSKYYHRKNFPLRDLFIASSEREKNIFINHYDYFDHEVVVTGFPRYDYLADKSQLPSAKRSIAIMPTYRDGQDTLVIKDFKNTNFFKAIDSLINDEYIFQFLMENKIELRLYLHRNVQKFSFLFDQSLNEDFRPFVKILDDTKIDIRDLIEESLLLITDYSSLMFDFIYLSKPFISYQFDHDDFLNSRTEKPLINLRKDLPGFVVNDQEELLRHLIELRNKQFKINNEHLLLRKQYFKYTDKLNCQRVFNAISNI